MDEVILVRDLINQNSYNYWMSEISWERFWRNRDGKVVVWQRPNALLWMWIFATIGTKLTHNTRVDQLLGIVAFGSIVVWAFLEIAKGDTYFRRVLGLIVLILTIVSRIS